MRAFPRPGIRLKMISLLAGLLLGVTGSMAWLSSQPFIQEHRDLILELNSEVSERTASQLGVYLRQQSERLIVYGATIFERSRLDADTDFYMVAVYAPELAGSYRLEKSLAVNSKVHTPGEAPADWRPILTRAGLGEPSILWMKAPEGVWTLGLALPLLEGGQGSTGRVVVGFLNPARLQDILIETDGAALYLVNSLGILLYAQGRTSLAPGSDLSNRPTIRAFLDRKFTNGQSREVGADPSTGAPVLSVFHTVAPFKAALISETPESEVFGALRKVQYRTVLVAIVIFCIAFFAGDLQAESITRPLLELARVSREIAQGRFDVPIEVTAKDEIGSLTDAFRKMIRELEARQKALVEQEKLATAGRIARNIGHEFGNILQPMIVKLDLLCMEFRDSGNESGALAVEDIIQIASLGSEICRGLMTLSRQQADAAAPVPFQLGNAARKAVSLLAHELKVKDVSPTLELDESISVMGVESQILQVVVNLLVNSLHAMPSGGKITLRTKKEGKVAILQLIDTGTGIKPENLPKIFEPLFSTKGTNGNGLGLSIARKVLEDHGGKITAQSVYGHGTTMTLELPLLGTSTRSAA